MRAWVQLRWLPERVRRCAVWTAVVLLAVGLTGATFPDYTINFLLVTGPRPPALIAEAAVFGLALETVVVWPTLVGRRLRTASPVARSVIVLLVLGTYAVWNARAYLADPPGGPPFASLLKDPKYKGASFLTSTYDGVVWTYTHGWTYMADEDPPSDVPYIRFRHLADWSTNAKYARPQYFLCDNSKFGWWKPVGDCRDVADAMQARGDRVIESTPSFAIVELHYDPGA